MASTSDIRDIMNLGQQGPRQPAPKKKKRVEPQMRVAGVTREVQALMGDSVPPIAIVEQKLYKSKPSISQKLFKPRHWEERQFHHGGRTDGLVLRHWKRSIPGSNIRSSAVTSTTTPTDVEMTTDEKESTEPEMKFEDEFPSHRWNVKVQVPSYSDEQYETHFKTDDWTREETDYLMELCKDFDLRWLIIADRYNPEEIPSTPPAPSTESDPNPNGTELVKPQHYPNRSMEALKSRYYTIAAKILETHTPASNMTQTEFQLWEKMRNFDAKTETLRKNMAEKLFERTKEEADEEKLLLEELYRITKNEEDFIKMRRDLYARLEPAPAIRRTERGEEQSTAMYQTSTGLSMLLQSLLAKEKRLKRPPMPGGEPGSASATPSDAQKWEKGRHPNQYTRRDTIDSRTEESGPQKKSSTSVPNIRTLTPAEELKFGVSHPQERLTSGVQFRHEKINRLTMAKSQVQTSKMQAALTELGIPARLLMPTDRVCREFERLVGEINLLLDARKTNEKVGAEIKVLDEVRRVRLGLPKAGEEDKPNEEDKMEIDDSQVEGDTKLDDTADQSAIADEDQDADGEEDNTQMDRDQDEDKDDDEEDGGNEESVLQANDEEEEEDVDADEDEDDNRFDQSGLADEEDEDEEQDLNQSDVDVANDEEEEADEEGEEDENEQDNDEEEEEEDNDEAEATAAVDEEEEEEDEDADADANIADASGSEAEAEDAEDNNESGAEQEQDQDEEDNQSQDDEEEDNVVEADEEEAEAEESVPSRPASPQVMNKRIHKRSASVVSEASKAGSNRSGFGRKKRR